MYSIFEEEDENVAAQHNQQRGMVPFHYVSWQKFKDFNKNYSKCEYTGLSNQTLRSLEPERLSRYQTDNYNMILDKEAKESLFDVGSANRDEYITVESRKRDADNTFQFNRIMKCSRLSTTKQVKNLHGTPYLKVKGYFKEENLDIG